MEPTHATGQAEQAQPVHVVPPRRVRMPSDAWAGVIPDAELKESAEADEEDVPPVPPLYSELKGDHDIAGAVPHHAELRGDAPTILGSPAVRFDTSADEDSPRAAAAASRISQGEPAAQRKEVAGTASLLSSEQKQSRSEHVAHGGAPGATWWPARRAPGLDPEAGGLDRELDRLGAQSGSARRRTCVRVLALMCVLLLLAVVGAALVGLGAARVGCTDIRLVAVDVHSLCLPARAARAGAERARRQPRARDGEEDVVISPEMTLTLDVANPAWFSLELTQLSISLLSVDGGASATAPVPRAPAAADQAGRGAEHGARGGGGGGAVAPSGAGEPIVRVEMLSARRLWPAAEGVPVRPISQRALTTAPARLSPGRALYEVRMRAVVLGGAASRRVGTEALEAVLSSLASSSELPAALHAMFERTAVHFELRAASHVLLGRPTEFDVERTIPLQPDALSAVRARRARLKRCLLCAERSAAPAGDEAIDAAFDAFERTRGRAHGGAGASSADGGGAAGGLETPQPVPPPPPALPPPPAPSFSMEGLAMSKHAARLSAVAKVAMPRSRLRLRASLPAFALQLCATRAPDAGADDGAAAAAGSAAGSGQGEGSSTVTLDARLAAFLKDTTQRSTGASNASSAAGAAPIASVGMHTAALPSSSGSGADRAGAPVGGSGGRAGGGDDGDEDRDGGCIGTASVEPLELSFGPAGSTASIPFSLFAPLEGLGLERLLPSRGGGDSSAHAEGSAARSADGRTAAAAGGGQSVPHEDATSGGTPGASAGLVAFADSLNAGADLLVRGASGAEVDAAAEADVGDMRTRPPPGCALQALLRSARIRLDLLSLLPSLGPYVHTAALGLRCGVGLIQHYARHKTPGTDAVDAARAAALSARDDATMAECLQLVRALMHGGGAEDGSSASAEHRASSAIAAREPRVAYVFSRPTADAVHGASACRGAGMTDDGKRLRLASYHATGGVDECARRCLGASGCAGIEVSAGGACELWRVPPQAVARVNGYDCYSLSRESEVPPPERAWRLAGARDRAATASGSGGGAGTAAYYAYYRPDAFIATHSTCDARCASAAGGLSAGGALRRADGACVATEYDPWAGLCAPWHRTRVEAAGRASASARIAAQLRPSPPPAPARPPAPPAPPAPPPPPPLCSPELDLARGRTVSSGSARDAAAAAVPSSAAGESARSAAHAVDGDARTEWVSAQDDWHAALTVELGQTSLLIAVAVEWGGGSSGAQYAIDGRLGGSRARWVPLVSHASHSSWGRETHALGGGALGTPAPGAPAGSADAPPIDSNGHVVVDAVRLRALRLPRRRHLTVRALEVLGCALETQPPALPPPPSAPPSAPPAPPPPPSPLAPPSPPPSPPSPPCPLGCSAAPCCAGWEAATVYRGSFPVSSCPYFKGELSVCTVGVDAPCSATWWQCSPPRGGVTGEQPDDGHEGAGGDPGAADAGQDSALGARQNNGTSSGDADTPV